MRGMSATERRGLLAGLAALAAAAAMLELALTRVGAVVFGPEAPFAVAPLALGATALGAMLAALPEDDRPRPSLAILAELACATAVAAIMVALHVSDSKVGAPGAEIAALGGRTRGEALLVAAIAALPFGLGGAAAGAALRGVATSFGWAGTVLGLGAAAGSVGGALALRTGGPRAALVAAVVYAIGAAAFTWAARARAAADSPPPSATDPGHLPPATDLSLAATAVVGSLVLLVGDVGAPWLKLKVARIGLPDRIEVQRWSELGLVTADRAQSGVAPVRVDGVKRGAAVDGRGTPPAEPEDLAFAYAPDRGPTLVVDTVGAGRTTRAALRAGQKELGTVVGSPSLAAELAGGDLASFGAALYDDARVRTRVGGGRAEIRDTPAGLKLLVVTAALPTEMPAVIWPLAGSDVAIGEAGLTTREALGEAIGRLAQDGAVVVRAAPEPERAVLGLVAALRANGATEPLAHLFGCGTRDASAVLARRTPLGLADVRALRSHCQKAKLTELLAPDQPRAELARRLAGDRSSPTAPGPNAPPATSALSAPPAASSAPAAAPTAPLGPSDVATDDRPFAASAATKLGAAWSQPGERVAATALAAGVVLFVAAALFARGRPSRSAGGGAAPALALGLLGAGLAPLEVLTSRWLTAAIGHPVFGLLAVLPALAGGLALGALATDDVPAHETGARAARRAVACAILVLLGGLALGPFSRAALGLPLAVRLGASIALAVVAAFPAGGALALLIGAAAHAQRGGAAAAYGLLALGQLVAIGLGTVAVAQFGYLALAVTGATAFGLAASLARPAGGASASS